MTTDTQPSTAPRRSFAAALGPGLIFAGASVGVSHLVQSTRAGVGWGLALWVVVLAALVLKYPPFRFGSLYSAATGKSLLEGYRRLGPWTLWLFALLTLGTMFAVQAAVTIVTAALLHSQLPAIGMPSPGIAWLNAIVLVVCCVILFVGNYRWLDRLTKLLVPVFTILTLVAAAIAVPRLVAVTDTFWPTMSTWEIAGTVAFLAALIGWMPTAIDISAWQSLWVLARGRETGQRPEVSSVLLDFNIGYITTGVLAFCFLILGASTAAAQVEFPTAATQFPGFFIDLYRTTVGDWAGGIVSVAAFAVMLSTTLAVLDGFPRVASVLVQRLRGPELTDGFQQSPAASATSDGTGAYRVAMVVLAVGAFVLLQALSNAFLTVVDVATIASFLTAPVLAVLNHRVMTSDDIPGEHRLSTRMRIFSWVSIICLSGFAAFYVVYRIVGWVG